MGTLYVVRHGETALNADGDKIRGWKDIPLDDKGRQEAEAVGKKIAGHKIDGIITSDLIRCVETAEAIAKATGAPILFKTMALRPWNLGDLQGRKAPEIMPLMAHLIDNPSLEAPGGESFNTFKTRAMDFVHTLGQYRDKNIVLVTHHRVERLMAAWEAAGSNREGVIKRELMDNKGEPPGSMRVTTYPGS